MNSKNPKTIVVFHRADYDGLFCREIAHKFLPDAELIGWDFGDKPLDDKMLGTNRLIVMDLPIDRVFGVQFTTRACGAKPPSRAGGTAPPK